MAVFAKAAESAASWEHHVRTVHAKKCDLSPCSLDVSPKTAQSYAGFSSLSAAKAEFQECLPLAVATFVCNLCETVAERAFLARREAVNFKKVLPQFVEVCKKVTSCRLFGICPYYEAYIPHQGIAQKSQAT